VGTHFLPVKNPFCVGFLIPEGIKKLFLEAPWWSWVGLGD